MCPLNKFFRRLGIPQRASKLSSKECFDQSCIKKDHIRFLLFILMTVVVFGCSKQPTEPSFGEDTYQLPSEIYAGDLTGEEILFFPFDSRKNYDSRGIYCIDSENKKILRLSSHGENPRFLQDHRVAFISDVFLENENVIYIVDHGMTEHIEVPVREQPKTWISKVIPLKGNHNNKIAYLTQTRSGEGNKIHIVEITRPDSVILIEETDPIFFATALPDGRIAYIYFGGTLKVAQLSENGVSVRALGEIDLLILDMDVMPDGRLIVAHFANESPETLDLSISQPGPQLPFVKLDFSQQKHVPKVLGSQRHIQVFSQNKFAYLKEELPDRGYWEPEFYSNEYMYVGEVSDASVMNVKEIFRSRIYHKQVTENQWQAYGLHLIF